MSGMADLTQPIKEFAVLLQSLTERSWALTVSVLCRLGDPEALLWSSTPHSGDTMLPTVLAHSGAESDKSSVVECMDWQSAGTMLATGSMDGWVRVWNKSGRPC